MRPLRGGRLGGRNARRLLRSGVVRRSGAASAEFGHCCCRSTGHGTGACGAGASFGFSCADQADSEHRAPGSVRSLPGRRRRGCGAPGGDQSLSRSHLMRVRLVAAASCMIAVVACSASRQARPDLPAPEYEPARALPAASAAASAAGPAADVDRDEAQSAGGRGRTERIGGGESAGTPKDDIRDKDVGPDLGESQLPDKPTSKDKTAARKRSDKPEPAASPEAPPSPTVIPAPPAQIPAR